jgi:hypothetical protein
MATHPRDVKDLSEKIDALLVNFGSVMILSLARFNCVVLTVTFILQL